MSSVFHSTVNDVVPWQSHYSFPSMATKAHKQTVKLRPTRGDAEFKENATIEIDFPSDGYMNTLNSVLAFDLQIKPGSFDGVATISSAIAAADQSVQLPDTTDFKNRVDGYFDNYIALFYHATQGKRFVATVVGHVDSTRTITLSKALPAFAAGAKCHLIPPVTLPPCGAHEIFKRVKTIYGSLVLEDLQEYGKGTRAIMDTGVSENYLAAVGQVLEGTSTTYNVESAYNDYAIEQTSMTAQEASVLNFRFSGQNGWTKRICLNVMAGTLTLKKLLPLKWMAAQFRLHLELYSNKQALICNRTPTLIAAEPPSFVVSKMTYIAELMDFDSTYDTAFWSGLKATGVPLRFPGLHYHSFTLSGSTHHLSVHERARSVKWAIAIITEDTAEMHEDSNAYSICPRFVPSKYNRAGSGLGSVNPEEQFEGQITEYQWRIGGKYYPAQPVDCTNGAAEAYIELLKLNGALGDYTFNTNMSADSWGNPKTSNKFIMACKFENDDVFPDTMSGINAEEQSDLSLTFKTSSSFNDTNKKRCDVFIGYESLLILKEGNNVELVL